MNPSQVAESIDRIKLQQRLTWYEDQIRIRSKSLAAIFLELRNDPQKPWRLSHESYEAYCTEVWSMSPRRIQQIAAGESVKALLASEAPDIAPVVQAMPEGQARVLTTIPASKRAAVIRDAVSRPGKMTAAKIKQAKARIIETIQAVTTAAQLPYKAKVCPHCGQAIPNCGGAI